ncbi:hypothetical protein A33M_3841 [Rhodovulum sp. PH10]|uniref:hypothetical protein n=1 Tax=Rhodovulum sp. PH10 TaxID=1187851 RepID=UPI00027C25E0|nr:hypothetical protein [Rhodovulum sp. PH10]EJW13421.1 hypothetical protein A33M_3841 [Rhodovulum sp. PH10]
MLKLAVLVWMMLGITLAGSLIVVVVAVPSLYAQGMNLIPVAGLAGFVVAIPIALVLAKKIYAATAPRA